MSTIIDYVWSIAEDTLAFVDFHNGGVTAVATVFIAAFTIVLALVTRRQARLTQIAAEATQKAATVAERALLDVERPHVLIENLRMHGFRMTEDERQQHFAVGDFSPSVFPRITFVIKNHGKSPAWVIAEVTRFTMVNRLPIPPQHGQPIRLVRGYAIPPGGQLDGECRFETTELSDADRIRVIDGEMQFFVYGYIEYEDIFRDINPKPHRSMYCWRYIVGGGTDPGDRFVPSGPDVYWSYA